MTNGARRHQPPPGPPRSVFRSQYEPCSCIFSLFGDAQVPSLRRVLASGFFVLAIHGLILFGCVSQPGGVAKFGEFRMTRPILVRAGECNEVDFSGWSEARHLFRGLAFLRQKSFEPLAFWWVWYG